MTAWVKKNFVLCIAILLAAVTSCIIPPDAEYASYFDWKTLSCLFTVLAVVCALKNIRFFTFLARKIVKCTGNLRSATIALVYITFIGSMLIANDMALLTFLPLGYYVLSSTGKEKHMAPIFILQNIAANLGGMLTPFGNPQNLYLYSFFNIPTGEFVRIMLPTFLMAVLMITACCFLLPKESITIEERDVIRLNPKRTTLYLALFALAVIMVFRLIPYQLVLLLVPVVLLFADRRALRMVDYPLLLTFVCFFIFAGNMSRIPAVSQLLTTLMSLNPLVVSVLSCQVISNVPSAILLSRFTGDYTSLLLGVNIGGAGTIIASLASLITFREYTAHNPGKAKHYLAVFSAYNFAFLIILTVFALII
ncbi:MAG: citrate transporter [Ruminococcaceae bacterium]|nr:citrate transporter [Oscillospiraceae bacterium]